ncbi:MAG: hypothetical protein KKA79_02495 [Nanoarchaeota archaeon]|nr:hypothetical protein [Nanoarchaeota archaeon]
MIKYKKNIKIPKAFRPNKDVDGKTNDLVEGANLMDKNPDVADRELEAILDAFDRFGKPTEKSHSMAKGLFEKRDFSSYVYENDNYCHWVKNSPYYKGDVSVVTACAYNYNKNYSYGRLPIKNFDDYILNIERLGDIKAILNEGGKSHWAMVGKDKSMLPEFFVGGLAGLTSGIALNSILRIAATSGSVLIVPLAGVVLGAAGLYAGRIIVSDCYKRILHKESDNFVDELNDMCNEYVQNNNRYALIRGLDN